jgi:hypothetical protein
MQFDFGTIDPSLKDGTQLASDLNNWRDALNSNHMAASAPSYVVQGLIWTKDVSPTVKEVYVYDGASSILLFSYNPSAHTTTNAVIDQIMVWQKAQRGTVSALTSGTTVNWDMSLSNVYSLALSHNATLANPSNIAAGQGGIIVITHSGSNTLAYGSYFKFAGGTAPSLTTGASAKDVLVWYADTTTSIITDLLKDVK